MSLFRQKKSAMVGLSLHYDEVRLLRLRPQKQALFIEDFAIENIPPGLLEESKQTLLRDLSLILKKLVKQTKSENYPAAIALPITQVISKQISLADYLTPVECNAEIRENLNFYLPGINEELNVDYISLGKKDTHQQELLLLAARTEQVNLYLLAAKNAGLKVKIIDVNQYALLRALQFSKPFASLEEKKILIDVDWHSPQFFVLQQNKIVFNQVLPKITAKEFYPQLKQIISLGPFSSKEKIFLSGKKELCQTISSFIQKQFNLESGLLNPFKEMKLAARISENNFHEIAPALIVTCGLALRSHLL